MYKRQLFEIGFAGGHGTASGMATVFQDPELLNWADGADLGLTTATIGLLAGIFGGMIIINYGVRKKYTKVLTEPATSGDAKEIFAEGERETAAYMTVSQDVVEPFAFHLGVIGAAILIGRAIVWAFGVIFGYTGLPLFPFAMIGGWIINSIVQRTSLDVYKRQTEDVGGIPTQRNTIVAPESLSLIHICVDYTGENLATVLAPDHVSHNFVCPSILSLYLLQRTGGFLCNCLLYTSSSFIRRIFRRQICSF